MTTARPPTHCTGLQGTCTLVGAGPGDPELLTLRAVRAIESATVLLVDDLIATGGTAEAAVILIEKMGGHVIECSFMIDLPDIGGRARLEKRGHKVFALCEFEGD